MHRIKNHFFLLYEAPTAKLNPCSWTLFHLLRSGCEIFHFFTPSALLRLTLMHVNTSSEGRSLTSPQAESEWRWWRIVPREMVGGEVRTFFSSETMRSRVREVGHILAAWAKSSTAPLSAAYRWQQQEARWVAMVTVQEGVDEWTLSKFGFTFSQFQFWGGIFWACGEGDGLRLLAHDANRDVCACFSVVKPHQPKPRQRARDNTWAFASWARQGQDCYLFKKKKMGGSDLFVFSNKFVFVSTVINETARFY